LIEKPTTQQENLNAQFNVSPFKKNPNKPINDMIRFFGFMEKKTKFHPIELVLFELDFDPVWFEFSKI
jgi:hypothetical protein